MTASPEARSTDPRSDGEWIGTRPGEHCLIRIAAEDTSGAYSVVEIISDPGDTGTPMHVHKNEDEHFLILEGTAQIAYGDRVLYAPQGASVSLVRNVPHAWRNSGDIPLRMLVTCTPGGVEDIFRIIARGGDIDLRALGTKFGVQVIGPMPIG